MALFRIPGLCLILLMALGGCRRETLPGGKVATSIPAVSKLLSVNLGNIGDLYDTMAASKECRSDSDTVVCTAHNGKVDHWISWSIPAGPYQEGDGTRFHRIGRWKGNGRFEVIQVVLDHDSPSFLFWDREGGGWIEVHPGTDSMFVAPDFGSILVTGWTPQSLRRWDYWKGLGGQAHRFVCTPPTGRMVVDTIARWIGPSLELVPLDIGNIDASPAMGCQEVRPQFDTAVPGYMDRPQLPMVMVVDSTKG